MGVVYSRRYEQKPKGFCISNSVLNSVSASDSDLIKSEMTNSNGVWTEESMKKTVLIVTKNSKRRKTADSVKRFCGQLTWP